MWTKSLALPAVLLAAMAIQPTLSHAEERIEARTLEQRYLLGDAPRVHVVVPFGELRVEGSDGRTVEVDVLLECVSEKSEAACRAWAKQVRLEPRQMRKELRVKLVNMQRGSLEGVRATVTVRTPRDVELEVDQRGGDAFITDMMANVMVGAVAGDVDIVARREQTREVDLTVGVGDVELWLGDGSIEGTGFPKSLKWNGPGTSLIKVKMGTGDVRVRFAEDAPPSATE